jgi:DNA-binding CsgD family transcriptional regulator
MERAELCVRHANECFLADDFPAAIASGWKAVECFRTAGDQVREGNALRELSYHLRCTGHAREAEEVGMQAVASLEQAPPGRELALAYANIAMLRLNVDDVDSTLAYGQRAFPLAQMLGHVECEIHVLNTLGTLELLTGAPEGAERLQRSLDLALAAGLEEHVGRFYVNYGWAANRSRSYADFEPYFKAGLEYCSERGLVLWYHYVLAYGARWALDQGRWSDAIDLAHQVLRDPRTLLPRIPALVVLALIRARRGDPDCWPLLDEALALAAPTGELQHLAPVAAARAEVAWLEGRPAVVAAATTPALEVAVQQRVPWVIGELACWRWRAGVDALFDGAAEPYALEIGGQCEAAADLWTQRGCPYEAALARAGGHDEVALRTALAALQRLGARVPVSVVARRLRELGARDLPRGPRPSTRSNAAHLTARELEVLQLLAHGLRTADIATHLYLSPKTVEHHISAILAKLQVRSRAEVTAYALAQGLVPTGAAHTAPR